MSIRGKKRQDIIDKWLRGEEDPEFEVQPTRNEGKYIIKPRDSKELKPDNPVEENQQKPQVSANHPPTNAPEQKQADEYEYYSEEEEEIPKHVKKTRMKNQDIQLEILNQLRILGEDTLRKRAKKERKRETKHMIRKELSRRRQIQYSDDDYEYYDEEIEESPRQSYQIPQRIIYKTPTYTRRRLNLLSDYR